MYIYTKDDVLGVPRLGTKIWCVVRIYVTEFPKVSTLTFTVHCTSISGMAIGIATLQMQKHSLADMYHPLKVVNGRVQIGASPPS